MATRAPRVAAAPGLRRTRQTSLLPKTRGLLYPFESPRSSKKRSLSLAIKSPWARRCVHFFDESGGDAKDGATPADGSDADRPSRDGRSHDGELGGMIHAPKLS